MKGGGKEGRRRAREIQSWRTNSEEEHNEGKVRSTIRDRFKRRGETEHR